MVEVHVTEDGERDAEEQHGREHRQRGPDQRVPTVERGVDPAAATSRAIRGSQLPMIWSTLMYVLILPMSLDSNTTKFVWTSGIFAATPRPALTNRSLTLATIGATSMATWLFWSEAAPSALPVRAFSTAECALRLPSTQTVSKAVLVTTRSTVPLTSCFRPLVIGARRLPTSWAAFGGTPFSATVS